MDRRSLSGWGGLLLLLLLAAGMVRLLQLRFDAGDTYPAYSSFRSDPMGVRALLEALDAQPGVRAERHLSPYAHLSRLPPGALFWFGVPPATMGWAPEPLAEALEAYMERGGRVVVSLRPESLRTQRGPPRTWTGEDSAAPGEDVEEEVGDPGYFPRPTPPDGEAPWVNLRARWGFDLAPLWPVVRRIELTPRAELARTDEPGLPGDVGWRGANRWTDLDPAWRTVYHVQTQPAIIERSWGAGSLVLMADSFLVSNEALRKDPAPGLLAWLAHGHHRVWFDEAHLGTEHRTAAANLMWRFRLHGLVVGVLLLAGLFAWRNATSLMPAPRWRNPEGEDDAPAVRAGRDHLTGFARLVRRAVAPPDIVARCWDQWRASRGRERRVPADRLEQAAALAARPDDPVRIYNDMATLLQERRPPV